MLSATSQYALRALTEMARLPTGCSILGRELAKKTGIPANYLSKILLCLRNEGLVATARGSGGGYWLLRPAKSIHLVEVVALFDGPTKPACLLGVNERCSHAQPCSAHMSWRVVREHYEQFLETTTLADIAGEHPAPRRRTHAAGAGGRQS